MSMTPPDDLGWFKADGELIAYPERVALNALLYSGFLYPKTSSRHNGRRIYCLRIDGHAEQDMYAAIYR